MTYLFGSVDRANPVFFFAGAPGIGMSPTGRVNVVLVYEDLATRQRAMQVYGELERKLGTQVGFERQSWKCSVLRNAKMRELAVHDALAADLIVISVHRDGQCAPELQKWVHDWSLVKTRAGGRLLVILRDGAEFAADAAPREFWRAVAHDSGMDLFCATMPEIDDELDHVLSRDKPGPDLSLAC